MTTYQESQALKLGRLATEVLHELEPKYQAAVERGDNQQMVHLLGLIQQTKLAQDKYASFEELHRILLEVADEVSEQLGIRIVVV